MAMTGEAVFFHKLIGSVKKKKSNYIFSLLLLKGQKCKGALRQDDQIASGCGLLPFPQGLANLPIRQKITSRHKIRIEKGLCPGDGMLPQEGHRICMQLITGRTSYPFPISPASTWAVLLVPDTPQWQQQWFKVEIFTFTSSDLSRTTYSQVHLSRSCRSGLGGGTFLTQTSDLLGGVRIQWRRTSQ